MNIPCDQGTPTAVGQYIWKHSLGCEMITVYWYPKEFRFGSESGGYLAVDRNRSVERLQGTFSKRLTFCDQ